MAKAAYKCPVREHFRCSLRDRLPAGAYDAFDAAHEKAASSKKGGLSNVALPLAAATIAPLLREAGLGDLADALGSATDENALRQVAQSSAAEIEEAAEAVWAAETENDDREIALRALAAATQALANGLAASDPEHTARHLADAVAEATQAKRVLVAAEAYRVAGRKEREAREARKEFTEAAEAARREIAAAMPANARDVVNAMRGQRNSNASAGALFRMTELGARAEALTKEAEKALATASIAEAHAVVEAASVSAELLT